MSHLILQLATNAFTLTLFLPKYEFYARMPSTMIIRLFSFIWMSCLCYAYDCSISNHVTISGQEIFEEAEKNRNSQNWEAAFSLYKQAAELGYTKAYSALGACYAQGLGTNKNIELATEWFKRGAEANDRKAQFNLANIYNAMGDNDSAFKYYELSAKNGYDVAKLIYAKKLYLRGEASPQTRMLIAEATQTIPIEQLLTEAKLAADGDFLSQTFAFDLCLVLSEKGVPIAQALVGECYFYGCGTESNMEQARKYYKLAAEKGIEEAHLMIYATYHLDNTGKPIYSPIYLSDDEYNTYRSSIQKAASSGHPLAQLILGCIYAYGFCGFEQNKEEAEKLLRAAAEQGMPDAMDQLGKLLNELGRTDEGTYWVDKAKSTYDAQPK